MGVSLPLQLLHTRALMTCLFRGAIYLAKKITRYGIFQNKTKWVYFNTPYQ